MLTREKQEIELFLEIILVQFILIIKNEIQTIVKSCHIISSIRYCYFEMHGGCYFYNSLEAAATNYSLL